MIECDHDEENDSETCFLLLWKTASSMKPRYYRTYDAFPRLTEYSKILKTSTDQNTDKNNETDQDKYSTQKVMKSSILKELNFHNTLE